MTNGVEVWCICHIMPPGLLAVNTFDLVRDQVGLRRDLGLYVHMRLKSVLFIFYTAYNGYNRVPSSCPFLA